MYFEGDDTEMWLWGILAGVEGLEEGVHHVCGGQGMQLGTV